MDRAKAERRVSVLREYISYLKSSREQRVSLESMGRRASCLNGLINVSMLTLILTDLFTESLLGKALVNRLHKICV